MTVVFVIFLIILV